MSSGSARSPLQHEPRGCAAVKCILAVSSCKGGVGKSTVSVNLAYAFARQGLRVGLFDADIYGPSLPTMVQPANREMFQQGNMILPLEFQGVKLMSFGYLPTAQENQAAILRGPMVSQLINQLLNQVDWGSLDLLVIDYPPGTGDIQLTLSQVASLTAAVIVTTPQQLSYVDVVKGIRMFDKLKVPTIAAVENMAWFEAPDGQKMKIFGEGARERLVQEYGFRQSYDIPVLPELSQTGDTGTPFILQHPDHPVARRFGDMANELWPVLQDLSSGKQKHPTLQYNVGQSMVLTLEDGREYEFSPIDLRMICRSAHRVDELTGERMELREQVPEDLYPTRIQPAGNYAVAVEWSDGSPSSIFPWDRLVEEFAREAYRAT